MFSSAMLLSCESPSVMLGYMFMKESKQHDDFYKRALCSKYID